MELSLISNEALIEELLNRFDHAIFSGIKILDSMDNECDTTRVENTQQWTGNPYTCVGMCTGLSNDILEEYKEEVYEEDDNQGNIYN